MNPVFEALKKSQQHEHDSFATAVMKEDKICVPPYNGGAHPQIVWNKMDDYSWKLINSAAIGWDN